MEQWLTLRMEPAVCVPGGMPAVHSPHARRSTFITFAPWLRGPTKHRQYLMVCVLQAGMRSAVQIRSCQVLPDLPAQSNFTLHVVVSLVMNGNLVAHHGRDALVHAGWSLLQCSIGCTGQVRKPLPHCSSQLHADIATMPMRSVVQLETGHPVGSMATQWAGKRTLTYHMD